MLYGNYAEWSFAVSPRERFQPGERSLVISQLLLIFNLQVENIEKRIEAYQPTSRLFETLLNSFLDVLNLQIEYQQEAG